mmetsp:Transcript_13975/g.30349  ORF Transcript_13975/g.30349 Transcript_13975/m.30349 type:complete len:259 (+) Transcript_13975:552-1328(+)
MVYLCNPLRIARAGDAKEAQQALPLLFLQHLLDSDPVGGEDLTGLASGGVLFQATAGVVVVVPPGLGAGADRAPFLVLLPPPPFGNRRHRHLVVPPVLGIQPGLRQLLGGDLLLDEQAHLVPEEVKVLSLEPHVKGLLGREFTYPKDPFQLAEINGVPFLLSHTPVPSSVRIYIGAAVDVHSHGVHLTMIVSDNAGAPPSSFVFQENLIHARRERLPRGSGHAQIQLYRHGRAFDHTPYVSTFSITAGMMFATLQRVR